MSIEKGLEDPMLILLYLMIAFTFITITTLVVMSIYRYYIIKDIDEAIKTALIRLDSNARERVAIESLLNDLKTLKQKKGIRKIQF